MTVDTQTRGPAEPLRLAFSATFWRRVALAVIDHEAGPELRVIVPQSGLAVPLRVALAALASERGIRVLRLPRVVTLADWIAEEIVNGAEQHAGHVTSDAERRVTLFDTLRQNAWLKKGLAAGGPAAVWSLARQLLLVGDELTRAAFAESAGDPERIRKRIAAYFRGRAYDACSPEAELVLGLWRAGADSADAEADPAVRENRALEWMIASAAAPLLVVGGIGFSDAHALTFFRRYAARRPITFIDVDVAASLAAEPLLLAAWPELDERTARDVARAPLRERASMFAASHAAGSRIALYGAAGLEDEATAVASRIVDWLLAGNDAGTRRIALIALDRLVARRVRALLERAEVLVVDETGWKLSTTSAAGALMRWLELASPDARACDTATLLDWAKSGFAWMDVANKAELLATVEHAVRGGNVAEGWEPLFEALSDVRADAKSRAFANRHLRALRKLAAAPRGRQPLPVFFEWLATALGGNGMQDALRSDRVGAKLCDVLDRLAAVAHEASVSERTTKKRGQGGARFSYAEWRGFVSETLENETVRDADIDSPVVFTSLAGASLHEFDAVVVVGADAAHFPAVGADTLFLTPGLRAELGLLHRAAEERQQLATLAVVLANAKSALVTWQTRRGGEPNAPAAAIERLMQLNRMANPIAPRAPLRIPFVWPVHVVDATPVARPAPSAPLLLPSEISASKANWFVSCPYRFFARAMLKLAPLDEVNEEAEKRDYGEVVHRILERFHRETKLRDDASPGFEEDDAERERCLAEISEDVFAPLVFGNGDYLAWHARWMPLVPAYIAWWRSWRASGWRFEAAELSRRTHLEYGDGARLGLVGRLDRVDRDMQNDRRVAILDYKARSKANLKKELAEPGEDVQLPFYRMLMFDALDAEALYLSVDVEHVVPVGLEGHSLDALTEAVGTRLTSDYARLAAGAAMPANGIDAVCKHCDARGLCRKGAWVDSGSS